MSESGATAQPARAALLEIVDEGCLVPDSQLGQYAVDGVVPKVAVFPTSEAQVASVLGLAARQGWAVVPRGSGSLMALGNVPERADVVIGLTRLSRAIEHAPADMTVTAGAGVTFEALQRALAGRGQWLPLDPPLAHRRTVGGMLATNLAGPLSLAYGTVRDMVIGMKVAGADGVITKSGGKVVKNVTGFDVSKAHIGALGTLGVILEASFKVAPLPKRDMTVVGRFHSLAKTVDACQGPTGMSSAVHALEVYARGDDDGGEKPGGTRPECLLYARVLGSDAAVERGLEQCGALLRKANAEDVAVVEGTAANDTWRRLTDFGWAPEVGEGLLTRIGCLPSRTRELAIAVQDWAVKQGREVSLVVSPGRGVIRCFWPATRWTDGGVVTEIVQRCRSLAASMEGCAVVERCPTMAKAHLDVWGDVGGSLFLMRRLKEQMDPGRILNPGRFVGGV